jgi:hypothetical protein
MTDAVTQGTFADFRLIKGRKVCQIVIEVPIEQADQALSALGGLPQPAIEAWVAIARLNGHIPEPTPDKEKKRWNDLKLAAQASIRCTEPVFWRFIQDEYKAPAHDEEGAAKFIRRYCGVKSRSELNLDPNCAEAWKRLESRYQVWLKVAA